MIPARVGAAAIAAMLCLLAAIPVANRLRSEQPPAPETTRIGVGRLMGGVLTGAFRPLLLNYLWIRADILHGQQRHEEQLVVYRSMTALYPNNQRAREYLGWLLAFNLKNETRDDKLAWSWAREGLEILVDARQDDPLFTDPLVDWFLKQAGQNPLPPFHLMRYAGPAWEDEKALRANLRAWSKERFGEPLDRFELGLRFNLGNERFSGRVTRILLLERQVFDDWVRSGRSVHVADAVRGLRWLAGSEGLGDLDPSAERFFSFRARMLEELAEGTVTSDVVRSGGYEAAISLFALGAHARDANLLLFAEQALAATGDGDYPEERALFAAWTAFAKRGFRGLTRPALPFD